jgi:hypothetical protein
MTPDHGVSVRFFAVSLLVAAVLLGILVAASGYARKFGPAVVAGSSVRLVCGIGFYLGLGLPFIAASGDRELDEWGGGGPLFYAAWWGAVGFVTGVFAGAGAAIIRWWLAWLKGSHRGAKIAN